jgi:predicted nucleic acid-binding protein
MGAAGQGVIVIDTNVLIALADPGDELNSRATSDLRQLADKPMMLTQEVLTEAFALAVGRTDRRRLQAIIESLNPEPCVVETDRQFRIEVLAWLDRYAEHDPDWTDAVLAVLAGRFPRWKVWTYDREFKTVWRTPAGRRIHLAANPVQDG